MKFAFGVILPCVYVLGYTGFSIEPNWYVLWTALPLALLGVKIRMTPAHAIGAVLALWALLSMAWAPSWYGSVEAALKLGAVACAFLLGAEEDDRGLWEGLAVGITINSGVAIAQFFGWGMVLTGGTPAGLLYNSNALAEPAALVAFWFLLDGRILWALPTIPAIVLPGTRAGFAILAVGMLAWLWSRSRVAALGIGIILALVGAWSLTDWRVPSTEQRVAIWRDAVDGITPLGRGLGSFGRDYPRHATRIDTTIARPFHAHSDILETTFELGFLGLALFAALCAACWGSASQRERILLLPCLALVAFDFPLYVPTTAFIVAFLAGRAAAGWHNRGVERLEGRHGFSISDEVRRSLRPDGGQRQVPI